MSERYTDRMRLIVVRSQELARERGHEYIGIEYLLLGLVEGQGAPGGHIAFTPRAKKALEFGLREALQLGEGYIGTEHHLLALIREGEGVAARVLVASGADLNRARQRVIQVRSGYQSSGDAWPEERPDSGRVDRPG
jgi:ATP-dependent Clp protease ATP-binding subunit ClpC